LLEEHPLKNQTERFSLIGEKLCAPGEVGEDGVGFGEYESVVVEQGVRPLGLIFKNSAVRLSPFKMSTSMIHTECRDARAGGGLVGIAGVGDAVQLHEEQPFKRSRFQGSR